MFIFLLSPNKKKKKIYTVLEFTKLEYCVIFFFFFLKKVLELGILEYCVNGTRVYQARVPQNFFNEELEFLNEELEFLKLEF